VHAIVRSVSRWTWKRFDIAASDARFSQVQAHRGSKGGVASGVARREATRAQRAMLARLAEKGKSTRAMALILGVNQSTVVRWLKSIG
jgi:DNA invertase Pin-like site-specific DNA recombinase